PRREPLLPPFLKSGSLSWIRTMTFMQPYGPGEEPIAILLPAAPKGSRGVDPTTGGRAGGYPSGQTQSALILARFDHPRGAERGGEGGVGNFRWRLLKTLHPYSASVAYGWRTRVGAGANAPVAGSVK